MRTPPPQVPFTLQDNDLSDDWECSGNIWDPRRAECSVPQELTNQEIDEILAQQVRVRNGPGMAPTDRVCAAHACACTVDCTCSGC